jgi:probable rRNA maturation factor
MKGSNIQMPLQILFVDRQRKYPTSEARPLIRSALDSLLAQENLGRLLDRQGVEPVVQMMFTGRQTMRRINLETRQIDRVTDVLSFPMLDMVDGKLSHKLEASDLDQADPAKPCVLLGDILICLDQAYQQAKDFGHSFEREVGFLAVHGLLHLLGYDHDTPQREQKMLRRQRRTLAGLGLDR